MALKTNERTLQRVSRVHRGLSWRWNRRSLQGPFGCFLALFVILTACDSSPTHRPLDDGAALKDSAGKPKDEGSSKTDRSSTPKDSGSEGGSPDKGITLGDVPIVGGCKIFPHDNFWNTPVDSLKVHPKSAAYIGKIGNSTKLHPDFGSFWGGEALGIPYTVVPKGQALVDVKFRWADESDCQWAAQISDRICKGTNEVGRYPIPADPKIEAGSDHHMLLLEQGTCRLYEIYSVKSSSGAWSGGSGAIWDLSKNERRGDDVTSADAAGLAILPGLIRFDEVYEKWDADPKKRVLGEIKHAIRVTLKNPQQAYMYPATHSDGNQGGGCDFSATSSCPPMGLRLRLKASFKIDTYAPDVQVILRALKKYGLVIADTGGDMYISGDHNANWDDSMLGALKKISTSSFEVVDMGRKVCPYPRKGRACEFPR